MLPCSAPRSWQHRHPHQSPRLRGKSRGPFRGLPSGRPSRILRRITRQTHLAQAAGTTKHLRKSSSKKGEGPALAETQQLRATENRVHPEKKTLKSTIINIKDTVTPLPPRTQTGCSIYAGILREQKQTLRKQRVWQQIKQEQVNKAEKIQKVEQKEGK